MITSKKLKKVMLSMMLLLVTGQLLKKLNRKKLNRIRVLVFLDLALLKWDRNQLLKNNQKNLKNHLLVKVEEDRSELLKWAILNRIRKSQLRISHLLVVFQ